MKPSRIMLLLGIVLIAFGAYRIVDGGVMGGIIPLVIGLSLCFLALKGGRVAQLLFGHVCIVVGAYLITWGVLLLPNSEPNIAHIFFRPLFWGIVCMMGGICGIVHGFCACVNRQVTKFEEGERKGCGEHASD